MAKKTAGDKPGEKPKEPEQQGPQEVQSGPPNDDTEGQTPPTNAAEGQQPMGANSPQQNQRMSAAVKRALKAAYLTPLQRPPPTA